MAAVVGEQHGKLDVVLRRRREFEANGFERLQFINPEIECMTQLLTHYQFLMEKAGGIAL